MGAATSPGRPWSSMADSLRDNTMSPLSPRKRCDILWSHSHELVQDMADCRLDDGDAGGRNAAGAIGYRVPATQQGAADHSCACGCHPDGGRAGDKTKG